MNIARDVESAGEAIVAAVDGGVAQDAAGIEVEIVEA